MSNLIKPENEFPSVTPFEFREIAGKENNCVSNLLCNAQGDIHAFFPRDPLKETEATIQNRLLEAERKAQELEKEAYEKAYEQGQKDGLEYGRKHMSIVKEQMEKLLNGLEELPDRLLSDYRSWLIDTCLMISRQVVRRELENDTGQLAQLIESLLKETSERYTVTVHLNPKDLDLFEKYTDSTLLSERSHRKLELKPDQDIQRGGCRLESDIELLDATIDKQFALIEQILRDHGIKSDATTV